jgi:hypothetical protein
VTQYPEDTPSPTLACIAATFERQAYPSVGSSNRPVESIQVSFPFVVSPLSSASTTLTTRDRARQARETSRRSEAQP